MDVLALRPADGVLGLIDRWLVNGDRRLELRRTVTGPSMTDLAATAAQGSKVPP